MKESYGEGLASHTGPESCAGAREGMGEALTGGYAGRVLSRETSFTSGVPTRSRVSEGYIGRIASARCVRAPRGLRPHARMPRSSRRNWEIPCLASTDGGEVRPGKPPANDGDGRTGEVGQAHCTVDAREQGRRCAVAGGAGRGTGPGQGQCGSAPQVPDTEPERSEYGEP